MTGSEVDEGNRRRDARAKRGQPDRGARAQQDPVGAVEFAGVQAGAQWPAARGFRVIRHQQLVCAALLVFDESTVPSLVVIEQLSRLTRNRLDACTEPTSDCEMGVTVSDHGMYTLRWVRLRPEAST